LARKQRVSHDDSFFVLDPGQGGLLKESHAKGRKLTPFCARQMELVGTLRILNVALTLFLGRWVRVVGGSGSLLVSDVIFVVITIAFFALGILYLKGCERLK